MGSALVDAVRASSARLGVSPSDVLTAMSYETGGRLDPNMWGGKNNNYLGLIQFGPEERAKYGVRPGMPIGDHVNAAENFLRDRGVQPGMGLLDIYSTINAGRPGLYDRSDANNGGAPGTVADKVATQMVGHRARANTLLGDESNPISITPYAQNPADPVDGTPATTANSGSQSPVSGTPADTTPDAPTVATALSKMAMQRQAPQPVQIDTPQPPGLPSAQKLAAIMQRLQVQNGSV